MNLPPAVAALVDELAAARGSISIVLGGSRAIGPSDPRADWDLGLYYRGAIDLSPLRARGDVYPPGSWGRLMNGGAWLMCDGERVDVLLRDLDSVDHWTHRAQEGAFEVDALLGYLAGIPTYTLTAELASCQVLHGNLDAVPYPARLMESAPARWRFCRSFSLEYARAQAERGNRIGAVGQVAKAVMEEGHAILCERGQWVCNEKRLIESAGLGSVQRLFEAITDDLLAWVDAVATALNVRRAETVPWSEAGRTAAAQPTPLPIKPMQESS